MSGMPGSIGGVGGHANDDACLVPLTNAMILPAVSSLLLCSSLDEDG